MDGDHLLKDHAGLGRKSDFESEKLREIVEKIPKLTKWKLARMLNSSQPPVSRHLIPIEKCQNLGNGFLIS